MGVGGREREEFWDIGKDVKVGLVYNIYKMSMKKIEKIGERDDDYVFYKDPKWKKRANCNQGAWTMN